MAGFLGRKGQESAPFELLVAIIVMGFVLIVGYKAIEVFQEERCKGEIESALQDLKSHIQITTRDGFPTRFKFSIPSGCFEDAEVQLKAHSDKRLCSTLCGEGGDSCVALEYYSQGYARKVCVNIPLVTNFKGQSSPGECTDRSADDPKYVLHDFFEGIPAGSYELFNVTPPNHAFPVICAYRKGL